MLSLQKEWTHFTAVLFLFDHLTKKPITLSLANWILNLFLSLIDAAGEKLSYFVNIMVNITFCSW